MTNETYEAPSKEHVIGYEDGSTRRLQPENWFWVEFPSKHLGWLDGSKDGGRWVQRIPEDENIVCESCACSNFKHRCNDARFWVAYPIWIVGEKEPEYSHIIFEYCGEEDTCGKPCTLPSIYY